MSSANLIRRLPRRRLLRFVSLYLFGQWVRFFIVEETDEQFAFMLNHRKSVGSRNIRPVFQDHRQREFKDRNCNHSIWEMREAIGQPIQPQFDAVLLFYDPLNHYTIVEERRQQKRNRTHPFPKLLRNPGWIDHTLNVFSITSVVGRYENVFEVIHRSYRSVTVTHNSRVILSKARQV